MANAAPRRRRRLPRFFYLFYGVSALALALVIVLGAIQLGSFSGGQPTYTASPISTTPPISTTIPIPTMTVGPGTPAPTAGPTQTPEPTPQPSAIPPPPGTVTFSVDNPLNLPAVIVAVLFIFTTLTGIASLFKFTIDTIAAAVRVVRRTPRA
jgi:hypothetical protein